MEESASLAGCLALDSPSESWRNSIKRDRLVPRELNPQVRGDSPLHRKAAKLRRNNPELTEATGK